MDLSLRQFLQSGSILIADGATGTMLMSAGLPAGAAPELWNVEHPDQIIALHLAYLEAGSQIILTNTFGGSRIKLDRFGLGERVRELNLAAVSLAKKASQGKAFVAGDIGPTGELMQPMGHINQAAVQAFGKSHALPKVGQIDLVRR
jgi:5-methyltetrahydrofolate--homocysteine methyltransferase